MTTTPPQPVQDWSDLKGRDEASKQFRVRRPWHTATLDLDGSVDFYCWFMAGLLSNGWNPINNGGITNIINLFINIWLLVWNIFIAGLLSDVLGIPSSQLTSIFFRGVETTNQKFTWNMTSWRLFVWCLKHRGRWPKYNWEMKIPMIGFIRKHALLLVKSQIRGVDVFILMFAFNAPFWGRFESAEYGIFSSSIPTFFWLGTCLTRHLNPVKQGLVLREPPLQKVGETSWQVPWLKAMVFMVVFCIPW